MPCSITRHTHGTYATSTESAQLDIYRRSRCPAKRSKSVRGKPLSVRPLPGLSDASSSGCERSPPRRRFSSPESQLSAASPSSVSLQPPSGTKVLGEATRGPGSRFTMPASRLACISLLAVGIASTFSSGALGHPSFAFLLRRPAKSCASKRFLRFAKWDLTSPLPGSSSVSSSLTSGAASGSARDGPSSMTIGTSSSIVAGCGTSASTDALSTSSTAAWASDG
mmetsp:Transcript_70013/g.167227  ORF Transcript_70013/g.167227 Transcript_70013/m.167227 type:complete len:224 (-) Transcript_70013:434-1105(-)